MRMLEAMHRGLTGDRDALQELDAIYQQAAAAPDLVFHGLFAALATYAARGRNHQVQVLNEPVPG